MIVDKPKVVEGFRQATIKGWEYALEHPDEIIDLILSKYKTTHTRESLQYEAKLIKTFIDSEKKFPIGHMDSKKWENIADTYSIIGMLPKVHSVKGFMYSNNRGTYKKNISNGVFIFCFLLEESFF